MSESAEPTSNIARVYIKPGCTVCGLCEDTCPEVFDVRGEGSVVRPGAAAFYQTHSLKIVQAVRECPVDVIVAEPAA